MNNSTANGLGQTRTKNKLANDAAVLERNKKGTGRRDNNSRSSSSGLTSGTSSGNVNLNPSKLSILRNINSKGNNQEAKNRFQRNLNRNIKIAEKIPIPEVQAAAKVAKVASSISSSQPKAGGIFKNLFGGLTGLGDRNSKKEAAEKSNAEAMGEEYEPGQAFGNVTFKLDKKTTFGLFIFLGVSCVALFICVIVVSSITDSAGRAYLASNENPTEEELGAAYLAQDGDSDGSSNSSGNSSSTSNHNVSSTGNATIDKLTKIGMAEEGNTGSKYRMWFYNSSADYPNVDWCAIFVSWMYDQAGGIDKYIKSSAGAGSIPRESDAAGYGTWYESEYSNTSTAPKAGDIVVFTWNGLGQVSGQDKYYSNHVGYVYDVDDKNIYTIEGNAGVAASTSTVQLKSYDRKSGEINGYFRPNY